MTRKTMAKLLFASGCFIAVVGLVEIAVCVDQGQFRETLVGAACVSIAIWCCRKNWPIMQK